MPQKRERVYSTDDDRRAAIRRVISGEPEAVVAHDIGRTLATLRNWLREWTYRCGPWNEAPLEPFEIALGYEIVEPTYSTGRRRVWRRDGFDEPRDARSLDEFLALLHRSTPNESRAIAERAWMALAPEAKRMLAPAWDVYLQACDAMDQVRKLRAMAIDLATAEFMPAVREARAS